MEIRSNASELSDLSDGQVAIDCKWVYAVKKNSDDAIQKLKSRLVAAYNKTFSPEVRYANIKCDFSLLQRRSTQYGFYKTAAIY